MADPLLARLSGVELSSLLPHVTARNLAAGEQLYRAGDKADSLYLIRAGAILLEDARGRSRRLAGHLGQEAILGSTSYAGTTWAEVDSTVLALPAAHLAKLAGRRREIGQSFFRSYADCDAEPARPGPGTVARPDETWRPVLGWILAIALPLVIYLVAPQLGLRPGATDFLAIVSAAVCMWLFSLAPEYVPPLFAAVAMILLDVAPPEQVLSGFRSDSFFTSLSIFGIGALMVSSGLTYRFSLGLLARVPATPVGYNLSLFGIGALLSPVIPSIVGRVSIVSPFLIELIEVSGAGDKDIYANRLIFSLLSGASILVPLFLTAAVPNLVVYGLFDAQTQFAFGWLAWLYAASVFGCLVLAGFGLVLALAFRGARRFSVPRRTIAEQRRVLGPISQAEWAALVAVLALSGGILTQQFHRIDIAWIALGIFTTLLLFGTLTREAIRSQIDWPILVYLGAIVGWVPVAASTGLDRIIVGHLTWLGDYMVRDFPLFVLLVSGMILLVRLALPTGVAVILFTTALFPLAAAHGISLWLVGFIILAVADTWIFPYQSSYFLKLRSDLAEHGLGAVCDERRLVLANIAMLVLRIAAIYGSLAFWARLDLL